MEACGKCGKVHVTRNGEPSCPGHIANGARKGEHCTHERGYGTEHLGAGQCKFHGGSTKNGNKHGNVALVESEARRMLGIEGIESISDPYTELANLAAEVVTLKNILREKVEELTTLKDVGGDKVATQIDVLMSAYERGLDRCERILTNMARLDLDGKIAALQARVDANTAELVSSALTAALSSAAIEPDAMATILQHFGNALRQPALKA